MIPTVLLVGLAVGVVLGWSRTGIPIALISAALLGIGWAALLAADPTVSDDLGSFLAAAALGVANALPALFVGRWVGERIPTVRARR